MKERKKSKQAKKSIELNEKMKNETKVMER